MYSPDDDHNREFVDQELYNENTEGRVPGTTPKDMGGKVITFVLVFSANQCFKVPAFHITALQEQHKSILDAQHFSNTDSFELLSRQPFRKQTLRFPNDVDPSSPASIFAKFYPDWLFQTITDNTNKKAEKWYLKHAGEECVRKACLAK